MDITFSIPDEQIQPINDYLATQRQLTVDEVTGASRVVCKFEDAEDFIHQQIGDMIHSIILQYPPAALRAQMVQMKQLQDGLRAASRPKKIKAAPVQAPAA